MTSATLAGGRDTGAREGGGRREGGPAEGIGCGGGEGFRSADMTEDGARAAGGGEGVPGNGISDVVGGFLPNRVKATISFKSPYRAWLGASHHQPGPIRAPRLLAQGRRECNPLQAGGPNRPGRSVLHVPLARVCNTLSSFCSSSMPSRRKATFPWRSSIRVKGSAPLGLPRSPVSWNRSMSPMRMG